MTETDTEQNYILNLPFEPIPLYRTVRYFTINNELLTDEISLLFVLSESDLSEKSKTMIIKMANDLSLYLDHYSLMVIIPDQCELDINSLLNSGKAIRIIYFGKNLHALGGSSPDQWHRLSNISFINTSNLKTLANDKNKAIQYWKCVKQVF
jgi:hypothetical protein